MVAAEHFKRVALAGVGNFLERRKCRPKFAGKSASSLRRLQDVELQSDECFQRFQDNRIELVVIGINLHPLSSRKVLVRAPRLRVPMPYASANIVERLAEL